VNKKKQIQATKLSLVQEKFMTLLEQYTEFYLW